MPTKSAVEKCRRLWRRVRYGRETRRYLEASARRLAEGVVFESCGPGGYMVAIVRRGAFNQVQEALEWLDWERASQETQP